MDPPLALAILAGGHACSREGQGTQQAGNQQIRTEFEVASKRLETAQCEW